MDIEELTLLIKRTDGDGMLTATLFSPDRAELPFELEIMAFQIRLAIAEHDHEWVNEEPDDYLYSFRSCCEYLGIDYQAARKAFNQRVPRKKPKPVRMVKLVDIPDIPGKVYTHKYATCGKIWDCPECTRRYNGWYRRNKGGRRREAEAAQEEEAVA